MTSESANNLKRRNPQPNPGKNGILQCLPQPNLGKLVNLQSQLQLQPHPNLGKLVNLQSQLQLQPHSMSGNPQTHPGDPGNLQSKLQPNPANPLPDLHVAAMTNKPDQSFDSHTNNGNIDCGPNAANTMTNSSPYPVSMTNEPNQSFKSNTNEGNIKYHPNAANIMDNRSILFTCTFSTILLTTFFIIWLWKFKN